MKANLTDITFLILIRLDSIDRLENILCVTERLIHYFDTNIQVREVDHYNKGLLEPLLSRRIQYEFIEDKDPILYRTKYINQMLKLVTTPYVSIWDVDIIPEKKAVIECMEQLRSQEADIALPYNGICYDIPQLIKSLYYKKKDMRVLHRHKNKMEKLHPPPLVGGAIMMNTIKYLQAGGENEVHYGWGNEDFDRYQRFFRLNYMIYRVNIPLFHLSHFRGENSKFHSNIYRKISSVECILIDNSDKIEKIKDIPEAEKVIE